LSSSQRRQGGRPGDVGGIDLAGVVGGDERRDRRGACEISETAGRGHPNHGIRLLEVRGQDRLRVGRAQPRQALQHHRHDALVVIVEHRAETG
jgi:hypothetical protein